MSTIKLITNTGQAVIQSEVSAGVSLQVNGTITAAPSCVVAADALQPTGETVKISPQTSAYLMSPDTNVDIKLDVAEMSDDKFRALLLVDMAQDVSVTFPDNVIWVDDTPTLTKGYIHCIDLLYIPTEDFGAFSAKYLGCISTAVAPVGPGLRVYCDGVLNEDFPQYGVVPELTISFDQYSDMSAEINSGVTVTALYARNTTTVTVQGGTVEFASVSGWYDDAATLYVRSGIVETVNLADCAYLMVSGGLCETINIIGREDYGYDASPNLIITGGSIKLLDLSGDYDSDQLFCYGPTCRISNCVVDEIRMAYYIGSEDDYQPSIDLQENVVCKKLDVVYFDPEDCVQTEDSIKIGPNCIVQLTERTNDQYLSGDLQLGPIDPTAQVGTNVL